jgi:hypothetical protein
MKHSECHEDVVLALTRLTAPDLYMIRMRARRLAQAREPGPAPSEEAPADLLHSYEP